LCILGRGLILQFVCDSTGCTAQWRLLHAVILQFLQSICFLLSFTNKICLLHIGKSSISSLDTPINLNNERFRVLLEAGDNRSSQAVAKAINYYNSCMDTVRLEEGGLTSLITLLENLGMCCHMVT